MSAGESIGRDLDEPRSLLPAHVRGSLVAAPAGEIRLELELSAIERACEVLLEHDARLIGAFEIGTPVPSLAAVFAFRGELVSIRAPLDAEGRSAYASISPHAPGAVWPERELFDRFGIVPLAHPDLRALRNPDPDLIRRRVESADVFVLPYGPVRSGVFEAIQFQIETGGEDTPALETRPFFKHRALEERMAGMGAGDAVYAAERVAGIASVAHALAYSQAVERVAGVEPPIEAQAWRAIYAELERIANHLDVASKEAETAALSVGHARLMILKENVLRLHAALTGSRFARGMVRPGGVREPGRIPVPELRQALDRLESDARRDARLFTGTASMTDRLIGTGVLDRGTVERFGGVGPVARGSGVSTDARFERPYGAYRRAGFEVVTRQDGDAMARMEVRFGEIHESLHLIRQLLDLLSARETHELAAPVPPDVTGAAYGWAEAPQGELVYWVEIEHGVVQRTRIASPSLRNWQLYSEAYRGDVLTDVGFIEHSFGLTPAGADR